jgi:hypothetical protein
MSDTAIFLVGAFTFLLLTGGVCLTYVEVRRVEEEAKIKPQSDGPQAPIVSADLRR